ncbi:MAG: PAS domain S-box protein, partial [Candidatus Dadabacteria bacterium]
ARKLQSLGGPNVLEGTAKIFISELSLTHLIIGYIDKKSESVKPLVSCINGQFMPLDEYCLEGTPCKEAIKKGLVIVPDNAAKLYPQDKFLSDEKIQAYAGAVLHGQKGAIGVIALMNTTPFSQATERKVRLLLELFSPYCGREVESFLLTQSLREEKERLRTLFNAIPDFLCLKDPEGRWIEANPTAVKLFELEGKNFIGKTDKEIGELSPAFQDALLYCMRTDKEAWEVGAPSTTQETVTTKKGEELIFDVLKVPMYKKDGSPKGLLVVGKDVTSHIKREIELATSKLRYQAVFEAVSDALVVTDEKGIILEANKNAYKMFKADKGSLKGSSITNFFGGSFKQWFYSAKRKAQRQQFLISNYLGEKDELNHCYVEVSVSTFTVEKKKSYLLAMRDITEQRLAQQRQNTLLEILEASKDIIALFSKKERLLYMNKAGREICGLSSEENLQKFTLSDFFRSTWQDKVKEHIREVLAEGQAEAQLEVTPLRKKEHLSIHFKTFLLKSPENDQYIGMATIGRDLSRVHKLEQMLRHAQKMEALGQLAGGIAHDFNNLLAVVLGNVQLAAELLENGDKTKNIVEALKHLNQVEKASQQGSSLINKLLLFSRKDSVKAEIVNVNEIVLSTEQLLRRLIRENIKIETEVSPGLPTISIEKEGLQQILINLCLNAQDAIPDNGKITISTHLVSSTNQPLYGDFVDGDYVLVKVSDTGIGFPKELESRIFEPFFTTKSRGKGTGLGLAVVHGIVKQCKGWIKVSSEEGKGTTFYVYFPAAASMPQVEHQPKSSKVELKESLTILVCEDQELVRDLITTALTSKGHKVLTAASPKEAVKKWQENFNYIDLVVCDVIMPQMNGFELIEKFKKDRNDIPALFVSGYTDLNWPKEKHLLKDYPILYKPFSISHFLDCVYRCVSEKSQLKAV